MTDKFIIFLYDELYDSFDEYSGKIEYYSNYINEYFIKHDNKISKCRNYDIQHKLDCLLSWIISIKNELIDRKEFFIEINNSISYIYIEILNRHQYDFNYLKHAITELLPYIKKEICLKDCEGSINLSHITETTKDLIENILSDINKRIQFYANEKMPNPFFDGE